MNEINHKPKKILIELIKISTLKVESENLWFIVLFNSLHRMYMNIGKAIYGYKKTEILLSKMDNTFILL